jgi:hypothetical protein
MRRIILLVTVAAMMAAMTAMSAAAGAAPPSGGGDTGCEAGQQNAYQAIGTGNPSGGESQAPYRDNPGQGEGPDKGFSTAESNTVDTSNCR